MSLVADQKEEVGRFTRVQLSQNLIRGRLTTVARMLCFLATRLAFGLLCLVTSVYCLLLYIPFSYYGFIHDPILWWLPAFVRLHAYLYGITFLAVAVTLIPDLRKARTRTAVGAFLLVNAGLSLYFILFSSLPHLRPDFAAYSWSIFGLFPVVWLGAIDIVSAHGSAQEPVARAVRESPDFASLGFSAIAVASGFAAVSGIRGIVAASQHLSGNTRLFGLFVSLGAHIAIFVIVGSGFILATKWSAWFRRSDLAHSVLTRMLAGALCACAVLRIALPTLSFTGALAVGVSWVVSLAIVVGFAGTASRLKIKGRQFAGIAGSAKTRTLAVLAGSFLLLAYAIPTVLAKTDWDFVLQKFAVLLLWAAVFMFLCKADLSTEVRMARPLASGVAIAVTLATLVGFYELNSSARGESAWSDRIEAYEGSDISFKTAADILSRSLDNGSHEAFYNVLRQHTNISAEVPAQPSAVELVSALTPSQVKKPNIFIFVIDSLRQDFVPQYSSTATFTPEIARFAGESVEFKKAFTRYAGTALSEPAIWVGALQAHKQYIQPFYPMNNLERLLENDGYDSYVSVDPILSLLFSPSFPEHRLDAQTAHWGELDFVPTLVEIERDIDARQDKQKPMFVYTQPQNVHTVTLELAKHGGTRGEMSVYELKRIDKAFGEFIGFLKKRGLYDNSIIVLTSDHGDSYGEFGRYGHSDFLFPEVIRVPLIIHLPSEMRREVVWDPEQVAFSMDVTPSLYYLLGYRPILNNELLGRPLFTATAAEQQPYTRKDYLLVSSYAPVYGILDKNADSLFIADAVNRRGYFYDFVHDPLGTKNEINPMRWNEGQKEVERQILLLDRAYGIRVSN